MDESRKQFESVIGGKGWFIQKTDSGSYVHERVHLMWMAWRESRAAIEIELPAKMISPAMTTPFLTWLIGMMEETLEFRNAQKPSAPLESK